MSISKKHYKQKYQIGMATTPGRTNGPTTTRKEEMQQTVNYLDQIAVNGSECGGSWGVSFNCCADNRDSLQRSTTKTQLLCKLVNETTNCSK